MPNALRSAVTDQDPRREPPHHMPEHVDPAPQLAKSQGNMVARPGVRRMGTRTIAMLVVFAAILGLIAIAGLFAY